MSDRTQPPIVFLDTETSSVRLAHQPGEIAALRGDPDGRHQAMSDVRWASHIYDACLNPPSPNPA